MVKSIRILLLLALLQISLSSCLLWTASIDFKAIQCLFSCVPCDCFEHVCRDELSLYTTSRTPQHFKQYEKSENCLQHLTTNQSSGSLSSLIRDGCNEKSPSAGTGRPLFTLFLFFYWVLICGFFCLLINIFGIWTTISIRRERL